MLKKMSGVDKVALFILITAFALGIYFASTDYDFYINVYTAEDHIVEWGTALALMATAIICVVRLVKLSRGSSWKWILGTLGFALIFFFGAGEEISWGQRILGIESSEFFKNNNAQKETNLHNLIVGEKSVNKLIFGQILTVSMIFYFIILPFLVRKWNWLKTMVDEFAIPLPRIHHTIAFLLATIVTQIMPWSRRWEINELAFGVVFLLIFLAPANDYIFKKSEDI